MKKIWILLFSLVLLPATLVRAMVTEREKQMLEAHGYSEALLFPTEGTNALHGAYYVCLVTKDKTGAKVLRIDRSVTDFQKNDYMKKSNKELIQPFFHERKLTSNKSIVIGSPVYPDLRYFYEICEDPNLSQYGDNIAFGTDSDWVGKFANGKTFDVLKAESDEYRKQLFGDIRFEVYETQPWTDRVKKGTLYAGLLKYKVGTFDDGYDDKKKQDIHTITVTDPVYLQIQFGLSIPCKKIEVHVKEIPYRQEPLRFRENVLEKVVLYSIDGRAYELIPASKIKVRRHDLKYAEVVKLLQEEFKKENAIALIKQIGEEAKHSTSKKAINFFIYRPFLIAAGVAAAIVAVGALVYKKISAKKESKRSTAIINEEN